MTEVVLKASDISCGHCAATINRAVGELQGVSQVETDVETKRVTVQFNPSQVSLAQIEATMDEEGYPVEK